MTNNRPRLRRSDHQPNLLEYIDTTLIEPFSVDVTLTRTISNGYDQFGNTILDQYLLYLLCQKLNPNRSDDLAHNLYHLLHELLVFDGKISKAFFEYSPPINNRPNYQTSFNSYTNFIWNELDVNILLELGCFLLKYRLGDLFTVNIGNNKPHNHLIRQKITGFFLEIIAVYYLSSHYYDFFKHSRSIDMIFPSPGMYFPFSQGQIDEKETFQKFVQALFNNGEIDFDLRQIKFLLLSDGYQFVNKKLENKKFDFLNFFERNISSRERTSCRSLKSICRVLIKMHVKQYPNDIKKLTIIPAINDQLHNYLIYENKFTFQSYV